MKNSDLLILAAAAVAAFFILKKNGGLPAVSAAQPASSNQVGDFVNGIFNPARVGDPGFGWQYFTNGTAIDSAGNYYFGGQRVWTNTAVAP